MFFTGLVFLLIFYAMLIGGFASEKLIKNDGETVRINRIWFWIMMSALILGLIFMVIGNF